MFPGVLASPVQPGIGVRRFDERREPPGDLGVPVGGGVLVARGRTWRGVTEAPHELGEGRAGLRSEDGPGVTQVVPAEVTWCAGRGGP